MSVRIDAVKEFFKSGKGQKLIVIAGLALIVLLYLSTLSFGGGEEAAKLPADPAALEQQLEQRLEELLSRIDGVSDPKVMVTLDKTAEIMYAQESRSSTSEESGSEISRTSGSSENSVVLVGSGSGKQVLEAGVIQPTVRGVTVVCGGAQDARIREKVVSAISGVLDIGASRICVTN